MSVDFDNYTIKEIINPSSTCTVVVFESDELPDIKRKTFVIFESHIKYISVEEHQKYKRVKIYFTGEKEKIAINFYENEYQLFDRFIKSIYND